MRDPRTENAPQPTLIPDELGWSSPKPAQAWCLPEQGTAERIEELTCSCGSDGLAPLLVLDIACGKHSGHAGLCGARHSHDVPIRICGHLQAAHCFARKFYMTMMMNDLFPLWHLADGILISRMPLRSLYDTSFLNGHSHRWALLSV